MAALVADFAHPAGNVTGLTLNSRQQHEKCLQLLKEAAPGITRVGVLLNPLNPVWQTYPDVLDRSRASSRCHPGSGRGHGEAELDQAFAAMAAQRVDGLFGVSDSTLVGNTPALEAHRGADRRATGCRRSPTRRDFAQGGRAPVARDRISRP